MKQEFKGTVRIEGKTYSCEVINGERFIDGKPIDEFMETLHPQTVEDMAVIGKHALIQERENLPFIEGQLQDMADSLHKRRVN